MSEQITVDLDILSRAALLVLTSDGTTVTKAVRAALVDAAEHHPEPTTRTSRDLRKGETLTDWAARQADTAPPLSDEQIRVLRISFIEGADRHWT